MLLYAVFTENLPAVQFLLQQGASPHLAHSFREDGADAPMLHFVVLGNNAALVELFLQNGADANSTDKHGKHILESAFCMSPQITEMLLRYNSDPLTITRAKTTNGEVIGPVFMQLLPNEWVLDSALLQNLQLFTQHIFARFGLAAMQEVFDMGLTLNVGSASGPSIKWVLKDIIATPIIQNLIESAAHHKRTESFNFLRRVYNILNNADSVSKIRDALNNRSLYFNALLAEDVAQVTTLLAGQTHYVVLKTIKLAQAMQCSAATIDPLKTLARTLLEKVHSRTSGNGDIRTTSSRSTAATSVQPSPECTCGTCPL